MRPSLFDQLYYNIDLGTSSKAEAPTQPAMTPAQRTPTTAEAGLDSRPQKVSKEFTGMKFTHSLIKHLDILYSKMLAGEISEMGNGEGSDEEVIDIAGLPHVQKNAYFNPGNSNVTESF